MYVTKQSWEFEQPPCNALSIIEKAGRTCYQSKAKENSSSEEFVLRLLHKGHESVIEHAYASVRIITDRGVSHELVRHRLASYSQESTRYCNYKSKHVVFVKPVWLNIEPGIYTEEDIIDVPDEAARSWLFSCLDSELAYKGLITEYKWSPEQARTVLNNSLKTEIVMTANLREWRHVFKLRCSPAAHPQMRELMKSMLYTFKDTFPVIFDDLHAGP